MRCGDIIQYGGPWVLKDETRRDETRLGRKGEGREGKVASCRAVLEWPACSLACLRLVLLFYCYCHCCWVENWTDCLVGQQGTSYMASSKVLRCVVLCCGRKRKAKGRIHCMMEVGDVKRSQGSRQVGGWIQLHLRIRISVCRRLGGFGVGVSDC